MCISAGLDRLRVLPLGRTRKLTLRVSAHSTGLPMSLLPVQATMFISSGIMIEVSSVAVQAIGMGPFFTILAGVQVGAGLVRQSGQNTCAVAPPTNLAGTDGVSCQCHGGHTLGGPRAWLHATGLKSRHPGELWVCAQSGPTEARARGRSQAPNLPLNQAALCSCFT